MKYGLDGLDFLKFKFSDKVLSEELSDKEKTSLQTKELIELESLTKDSIVLDIGSNFGLVVDGLQAVGCKVYAFEPHPIFFSMLKKKHFENQNVILSDNAVWKTNEKRNFYFKRAFDRLNGGATLLSEKTNITDLSLKKEVQCIDISEVIRVIGSDIDVLKMDVEGAEYQILDRLFKTGLYKKVKSIYFEDHSRKFVDKAWHSRKERVLELYKSANIELNWW